jgi:hypothetical protein
MEAWSKGSEFELGIHESDAWSSEPCELSKTRSSQTKSLNRRREVSKEIYLVKAISSQKACECYFAVHCAFSGPIFSRSQLKDELGPSLCV